MNLFHLKNGGSDAELLDYGSAAKKRVAVWLFFIIATALFFRLWNITWGLPDLNEEAFPLTISLKFWNLGKNGFDFNPHFFNYPGLTFYINFLAQSILYLLGHLAGSYPNLDAFTERISHLVITSRLITLLFDAGTILVVYMLTRRLANMRAALLAAALVALNPLHIKESHLINVDVPMTFFAVLSIYFIHKILETRSQRWYILAGISTGAAAASKYNGAFLIPVLVAAHMMREESFGKAFRSLKRGTLWTSLAAAAFTFFIFNPYIILSYSEFLHDISFEQYHMSYGHLGLDASRSSPTFYLLNSLPVSLGWGLYTAVLASTAYLLLRVKKANIILLAFPLIFMTLICSWKMHADRYTLPAIPFLISAAAIGMDRAREYLGVKIKARALKMAALAAGGLIIGFPLISGAINYDLAFSRPDTRALARDWMLENVAPGSTFVTGPFGIKPPKGRFVQVDIPFTPTGSEALAPFYDARWYEDFELLITSDYDYARFRAEPERFSEILAFYDTLNVSWRLLYEINPGSERTGPSFRFYRPPPGVKKEIFDQDLFLHLERISEKSVVANFAEHLAQTLFMKGRLLKSEQLIRTAALLEGENTRILKEFTWTLFNLEKFNEALALAESSLRLNPDQAEIVALKGSILLRLQRADEAEKTLEEALRMNDRLEMAYLDLELLYRKGKDDKKIYDLLTRYLKILPPESENAKLTRERLSQIRKSM